MKGILYILLLYCLPVTSQGLIFNATAFDKRSQLEISRSDKVEERASLLDYAPSVLSQKGATCVAISIANARTILLAKLLNITNKRDITKFRFSPYWVYMRNKEEGDLDCSKGLDIEKTLNDLECNGIISAMNFEFPNFYPFTDVSMCNEDVLLIKDVMQEAKKYVVSDVYGIHGLEGIKVSLTKGMPVIVGMITPESFINAYSKDIWSPTESDISGSSFSHAMVIVGYDDNMYGGAVQIMNSWGGSWGNLGFIWIHYDDLLAYTLGAYAMKD